MITIYPSLIAAPSAPLALIKTLEPYCAGFHLDIQDHYFVPTSGLSLQVVNHIDTLTKHPSWVHLMVQTPLSWIEELRLKPQSIVSFHLASQGNPIDVIKRIKENSWKASLAISPKTAVGESSPYLHLIDQLLIMSVQPGHSGQSFLPSVLGKVASALAEKKKRQLRFEIAMDGGINRENIDLIVAARVNAIAIGSAICQAPDPLAALKKIQALCDR